MLEILPAALLWGSLTVTFTRGLVWILLYSSHKCNFFQCKTWLFEFIPKDFGLFLGYSNKSWSYSFLSLAFFFPSKRRTIKKNTTRWTTPRFDKALRNSIRWAFKHKTLFRRLILPDEMIQNMPTRTSSQYVLGFPCKQHRQGHEMHKWTLQNLLNNFKSRRCTAYPPAADLYSGTQCHPAA